MSGDLGLRYLIVGTGRSGTVYLAKLLTSAGIPCSHERIFGGGDVDDALEVIRTGGKDSECSAYFGLDFNGPPVAEASYMAVPFLGDGRLRDCAIIHAVRDPLKVIGSFLNNILFFREDVAEFLHPQETFIRKHLPQLDLIGDAAGRANYYYLRWNQMIEEASAGRRYLRYRVEDGPGALLEFVGAGSGKPVLSEPTNVYSQWPENMRRETALPKIGDDEIMASRYWEEVAALARHYGYPYPETFPPQPGRAHPGAGDREAAPAARAAGPAGRKVFHVAPRLVEEGYRGFNVVEYREAVYAIDQALGPLDIPALDAAALQVLRSRERVFVGQSAEEARSWVDRRGGRPLLRVKAWLRGLLR